MAPALAMMPSSAMTPAKAGTPQSRQSAKFFLQSLELGLPQPLNRTRVFPFPFWFRGEGHTRWLERGWESPNPTRGHTLWYSLYVCT
jgi:hypothetical protein